MFYKDTIREIEEI